MDMSKQRIPRKLKKSGKRLVNYLCSQKYRQVMAQSFADIIIFGAYKNVNINPKKWYK